MPLKSIRFLSDYFDNICQIKTYKNWRTILLFKLVMCISAYKSLHFVYLFLFPTQSDYDFLLHYDLSYLVLTTNSVTLLSLLTSLQAAYNTYVLYFDFNPRVNQLLWDILLRKNVSYFCFNRKHVHQKLTKFYLLFLNVFHSFTWLIGIYEF